MCLTLGRGVLRGPCQEQMPGERTPGDHVGAMPFKCLSQERALWPTTSQIPILLLRTVWLWTKDASTRLGMLPLNTMIMNLPEASDCHLASLLGLPANTERADRAYMLFWLQGRFRCPVPLVLCWSSSLTIWGSTRLPLGEETSSGRLVSHGQSQGDAILGVLWRFSQSELSWNGPKLQPHYSQPAFPRGVNKDPYERLVNCSLEST